MHRHEARENRPIAQLAIGVKTPGPDCAVVLERQAVAATGGNSQEPAQVLYSHRREALGAGPIAQFAIEVRAPSPGDTIGPPSERLVAGLRLAIAGEFWPGELNLARRFDQRVGASTILSRNGVLTPCNR